MNSFRYTLEPYRGVQSRYTCPHCGKRQQFTKYIDTQTGAYLADHVGKCNRLEQCGYYYPAGEYFKSNPDHKTPDIIDIKRPAQPVCFDTISPVIMNDTIRDYNKNHFTLFLARMFGAEGATSLIQKYKIGCAKYWRGATIFWQIDTAGKVRTGKIMLYNPKNCKRVKEPFSHIAWAHSLVVKSENQKGKDDAADIRDKDICASGEPASYLPDYALKQCLFGEHLLKLEPFKIVAIAESEKTAIIASMHLPNYIWLAAGGMEGLTVEKCKVLAGRTVRLYPDVNAYAKWHTKAHELNKRIPTATFVVDNTLTINPTSYDRERGIDIADKWIDNKLLEWGRESIVDSP